MITLYPETYEGEVVSGANVKSLDFVYCHGTLQWKVGYDLLNEHKKGSFDKRRVINGEDAVAILPNGEQVECLLFFWKSRDCTKSWRHTTVRYYQHGLLVEKTDKKSIKYARKQLKERAWHL